MGNFIICIAEFLAKHLVSPWCRSQEVSCKYINSTKITLGLSNVTTVRWFLKDTTPSFQKAFDNWIWSEEKLELSSEWKSVFRTLTISMMESFWESSEHSTAMIEHFWKDTLSYKYNQIIKNLVEPPKIKKLLERPLHKICENTSFQWPVFSRMRPES